MRKCWIFKRANSESIRYRRRQLHRQHVCVRLLARGDEVVRLDNLNEDCDDSLREPSRTRLTPATAVNEGMRRFVQWYRGFRDSDAAACVGTEIVRLSMKNDRFLSVGNDC